MIILYSYLIGLFVLVCLKVPARIGYWGSEKASHVPLDGEDKFFSLFLTLIWPLFFSIYSVCWTLKKLSSTTQYWSKPEPIRTPAKVLADRREAKNEQRRLALEKREAEVLANQKYVNEREAEMGMELSTWE